MTTTSQDISVVMFDDQQERKSKADLLHDETGYKVHFVDLQHKPVFAEVEKAVKELPEPSMVLVDHILVEAIADSTIHKGTSIAPFLRERWPHAPVIALTAAYDACVNDIESEVYEDVIAIERFSNFVGYVPSLISGYQALAEQAADIASLFELLRVPNSEKDALYSSLPSALKRPNESPSFSHRVFRWFRWTFYRKPGFLLDRQWTALAIGVSSDGFTHYEPQLTDARYDGIFAEPSDARWWKARLYSSLLPETPERFTISLCEAAKQRLKIPAEHESKCFRCGEKWPEVMAYVDESAVDDKNAKPMHLRCSKTHVFSSPEPFYEERRVMLDDE